MFTEADCQSGTHDLARVLYEEPQRIPGQIVAGYHTLEIVERSQGHLIEPGSPTAFSVTSVFDAVHLAVEAQVQARIFNRIMDQDTPRRHHPSIKDPFDRFVADLGTAIKKNRGLSREALDASNTSFDSMKQMLDVRNYLQDASKQKVLRNFTSSFNAASTAAHLLRHMDSTSEHTQFDKDEENLVVVAYSSAPFAEHMTANDLQADILLAALRNRKVPKLTYDYAQGSVVYAQPLLTTPISTLESNKYHMQSIGTTVASTKSIGQLTLGAEQTPQPLGLTDSVTHHFWMYVVDQAQKRDLLQFLG